jgi:hypothetical protein
VDIEGMVEAAVQDAVAKLRDAGIEYPTPTWPDRIIRRAFSTVTSVLAQLAARESAGAAERERRAIQMVRDYGTDDHPDAPSAEDFEAKYPETIGKIGLLACLDAVLATPGATEGGMKA